MARWAVVAAIGVLIMGGAEPAFGDLSFDRIALPAGGQERPLNGGEPLLAFDPSGNGRLYFVGSAFNTGIDTANVSFWASPDRGESFESARYIGTRADARDVDVTVGADHTVYVADINGVNSNVCRSRDGGRTFGDDCEGGVGTNRWGWGVYNDRQWLVADPQDPSRLYFAVKTGLSTPLLAHSRDGGSTFEPCRPLVDPTGPFADKPLLYMMRPVVAPDGTVHVPMFLLGAFLGVATVPPACAGPVRNVVIGRDPDGRSYSFGVPLARDGGGGLWLALTGAFVDERIGVFLFHSQDGGETWSDPVPVAPSQHRVAYAAVTGGLSNGQVAVGWYERVEGDDWRYQVAVTYDGAASFLRADTGVAHSGQVGPGSAILEFTAGATDPANGCVNFAVPRGVGGSAAGIVLARQRDTPGAPCLRRGARPARGDAAPADPDTAPSLSIRTRRLSVRALRGRRGAPVRLEIRGAVVNALVASITDRNGRVAARGRRGRSAGRASVALRARRRLRPGRYLLSAEGLLPGGSRLSASRPVRLSR